MDDLRLSRICAAAARLGDFADDKHRFIDKRVLLTGEHDVLASKNGQACLLDSLRLLVRICPNLTVSLPNTLPTLLDECRVIAAQVAFGAPVVFDHCALSLFDAVLSIGCETGPALPWTVINSNGWVARVSSGSTPLPAAVSQYNPIGALAAASLGVTEVFKHLINLKPARGGLMDGLSFSLYSYCVGDDDPGPELPEALLIDLLLVGVGAIGNGVVHLLTQLPIHGRVRIVDPQIYGSENLGTCFCIGPADVGIPKAEFAENLLKHKLNTNGYHEDLESFCNRLNDDPYPRHILCGLDKVEPRRLAQALWPDVLIDGAIGDFPCQVAMHLHGKAAACMMCLFQAPVGPSAHAVASTATGLSESRVQQPEALVTENDVAAAPPEKRQWLHNHIGRPICSVTSEGVAQHLSEVEQRGGFQPSVPFVATMSGAMVVGEYVKYLAGWGTALETRYQFDVLRGPDQGLMVPQESRQGCECVTRAKNINAWRNSRVK